MARRSAGVSPVVEFLICLRCATAKAVTKAHGQADRTGLAIHHDPGPRLHLLANPAVEGKPAVTRYRGDSGPRVSTEHVGRGGNPRNGCRASGRWWLIVLMLATVGLGVVVLQMWPASDT